MFFNVVLILVSFRLPASQNVFSNMYAAFKVLEKGIGVYLLPFCSAARSDPPRHSSSQQVQV